MVTIYMVMWCGSIGGVCADLSILARICTNLAMITVSVSEAKDRLPELLRKVEAGERVTITRHGKPVGEIGAPGASQEHFLV